MDKQIALTTLVMGLVLFSIVSASGFNQVAGPLYFNLTGITSQTRSWVLINNETSGLSINITTPQISGITITSSVGNTIIPANSQLTILVTASLNGAPANGTEARIEAFVSAFQEESSSNALLTTRTGLSKELVITANIPGASTTTTIQSSGSSSGYSSGYYGG